MSKKLQQVLAFIFGVAFVIVLLVLAISIPEPTQFQYTVFRTVLALSAAGVAAMIPGFLQVTLSGWLRAGGALGVFVVVYFYNPAALVGNTKNKPLPTAMFPIVLACNVSGQVKLNTFTFPYSDIKKKQSYSGFKELLTQLPNQACNQSDSKIFRLSDEVMVNTSSNTTLISGGNLGAIIMPQQVIDELGGNHLAFTKIHSYMRSNETQKVQ